MKEGAIPRGWTLRNGTVARDEVGESDNGGHYTGSEPGADVLHVQVIDGKEVMMVTALGIPLQPPPIGRVLVVDEKPLPPDGPRVANLSLTGQQSRTTGHSNNWTVTPWLTNDSALAGATIIVNGYKSIDTMSMRAAFDKGYSLAACDNGIQSDSTFLADLEHILIRVCKARHIHLVRVSTTII